MVSRLSGLWNYLLAHARTTILVAVVLSVTIISTYCIPTGEPHVEVKAEPLFYLIGSAENPFFPFVNSFTIMLIADVIVIGLAFLATRNMQMVPRGLQNVMEMVIEALYNLFQTINRDYVARAFPLAATLFLYVLVCNLLGLLPGVGSFGVCHVYHGSEEAAGAVTSTTSGVIFLSRSEGEEGAVHDPNPYDTCAPGHILVPMFRTPSADLNFTFGIATIAWVYIEYLGFKALGRGYLRKFFNTKGIMSVVGIFEFIGELVKLPAFAFRLFGNIFAGEVVLVVLAFLIPVFLPMPLYVFELFVGFIQAFIFAVLTMAFITVATTSHEEGHEEHGDHATYPEREVEPGPAHS